jgi:hypothetical protein
MLFNSQRVHAVIDAGVGVADLAEQRSVEFSTCAGKLPCARASTKRWAAVSRAIKRGLDDSAVWVHDQKLYRWAIQWLTRRKESLSFASGHPLPTADAHL